MSEFCAGVKILLERMKSNPEDFEMLDYDVSTVQVVEGRFYQFAQLMEQMISGRDVAKLIKSWYDWHYFTEEERQALIAGFKDMKRAKFDKGIMERVFDEQYVERQREQIKAARQPLYIQPSTFQTITTDNTAGGLLNSIGLGGIFGGGR